MSIDPEVRARVSAAAEGLYDETVQLIRELVRIPSESPNYAYAKIYQERGYTKLYDAPVTLGGEKKVAEHLQPVFSTLGAETFMEAKEPLRPNLIGILPGSGGGRSLALNAHTDTVPTGPHEEWRWGDPFSARLEEGKLWGRGSTDDKGPLACMIKAVEVIQRAGFRLRGELQLHATVGEETMDGKTHGPGYFLPRNPRCVTDACLVCESSAPPHRHGICLASGGASWLHIEVTGKPVHAAMGYRTYRMGYEGGDVGMDAIGKALKIYRGLAELDEEWADSKIDPRGLTPMGYPSIITAWIHGHPKGIEIPFFVADHCELGAAVWRDPQDSYERVRKEVDDRIQAICQMDPWLREHPPDVQWRLDWPPFRIEQDHPLVTAAGRAYETVLGQEPRYMTWQPVSDARFYQECGVPSLLMGPGDYRRAHCYDEYLELDQIVEGLTIYALTILEWCGFDAQSAVPSC